MDIKKLIKNLEITELNLKNGLSNSDIISRRKKFGKNQIEEKNNNTALNIFFKQFKNFIIIVLILAAAISYFANEIINFYVINLIISMVIILGFFQEYRAQKTLEALKKIIKQTTKVIRNSTPEIIETKDLVVGDLLVLEAGDNIPADAILIESNSIRVDESVLTGESVPVDKSLHETILAGTVVVYGLGKALVTKVGNSTEFGKIAQSIKSSDQETPLQKNINILTRKLAFLGIFISIFSAVLGYLVGADLHEVLILGLTLSVATIPEGLPLTLTLTLMNGTKKLAQSNALIRKLIGVETLGACTYICTDKTGTLTQNKMTVEKLLFNQRIIDVKNQNSLPVFKTKKLDEEFALLLNAMSICNNASLTKNNMGVSIVGDPTEGALLMLANNYGLDVNQTQKRAKVIKEFFFTSDRKIMSKLVKVDNKYVLYSKGAVEVILENSNLSLNLKKYILQENNKLAQLAYRNLAIGYRVFNSKPNIDSNLENDINFLGLTAMIDPPKKESVLAVNKCKQAGIKVVMITGDNKLTAVAIARQVGIYDDSLLDNQVITGAELEKLSQEEFKNKVGLFRVYARVKPDQKLKIVEALQANGEVVAMTGDGVNDAPAIKKANIGIAMGITGTDVSKQASVMILEDDNFSTIVKAVELGRGIYENIEKFTLYLISQNFNEIILILLGLVLLGPDLLPLTAIQILFINTFDEVLPSLSLGFDSFRDNIMNDSPRDKNQNIMTKKNLFITMSSALFMSLSAFTAFFISNPVENIEHARTVTFLSISLMILFRPYSFKSLRDSIFKRSILDNKLMIFGSVFSFLVAVMFIYIPFLESLIGLEPLSLSEWILPSTIALFSFVWIEYSKYLALKYFN